MLREGRSWRGKLEEQVVHRAQGGGGAAPAVRLALHPPLRSSRVWAVGLSNCVNSDPGVGD